MDLVLDLTKQLSEQIKRDETYTEYLRCYDAVKEDRELFHKMNEMRRKNVELQNDMDRENFFDAASRLRDEYSYLLSNKAVSDFLKAEMRFCRKMQKIYTILTQDLEIDLDFLS